MSPGSAWRAMLRLCMYVCVCLGVCVPLQPAWPATARAAVLPAELQQLAAALRTTPMRCVPFEQRKHIASLQRALSFRGELSVAADRRVHWRLRTPVQVEYQFLRDGAWRRGSSGSAAPDSTGSAAGNAAGRGEWTRLAVPDAASRAIHDMLSALLDLDPVALTRQFELRVTGTSPLAFEAVPKDARLRRVITKVSVQGGARIERMRVDEAGGNWSEYVFALPAPGVACDLPAPPRG